jgi:branched-chain amino acid transport system permease protein
MATNTNGRPSSRRASAALPEWLKTALKIGLIGGIVSVFIALEGMVVSFDVRYIIGGVITMGRTLLLIALFGTTYFAVGRSNAANRVNAFLAGIASGLVASICLVLLVAVGTHVNIGAMLVNAVPAMYDSVTFKQGLVAGSIFLLVLGVIIGAVSALLSSLPSRLRRIIVMPLVWVVALGLFQDLLTTTFSGFTVLKSLLRFLYVSNGMSVVGAVTTFIVMAALYYVLSPALARFRIGTKRMSSGGRKSLRMTGILAVLLILLALPSILGLYISQVLDDVGLYVLMGLGLNIVVGFAGLLDLGYVAFFAIGAYTMGVLTTPDFGHPAIFTTFWEAVPFSVLAALVAGALLGIPVLRMRGDYLAIVTLGFGEIIRLFALSDFLKPLIGGAQGILDIGKPVFVWVTSASTLAPIQIIHPQQFYYIFLAGCALVAFFSLRLKDSRIGRAWMAMREDEDVAQAMGIELVSTKLLAFGLGASFGGLSGALFASQIGSIFPTSFSFLVSVNILSLIIIGGMGNIPGVILGAFVLVGLPELLREFSDYRFLFYGAALVLMMLTRPEGLIPEARRKEELEEFKEEEALEGLAPLPEGVVLKPMD